MHRKIYIVIWSKFTWIAIDIGIPTENTALAGLFFDATLLKRYPFGNINDDPENPSDFDDRARSCGCGAIGSDVANVTWNKRIGKEEMIT